VRLQDLDVYASGPPAMVEAVRHEFTARGLPAEQLFFDSFDYAPDVLAKLTTRDSRHPLAGGEPSGSSLPRGRP
jgi:ferredoxin-NADP reductase